MKVPSIAMVPWRTGSVVAAAAWAIGALPSPASFEKTPRATPKRIAAQTAAPVNPPAAAVPVKAPEKTLPTAAGSSAALTSRTVTPTTR